MKRSAFKRPKVRIKKDYIGFGISIILTIIIITIWNGMIQFDIYAARGSKVDIETREEKINFTYSYSTYREKKLEK